jgi:hypothetical protein
MECLLCKREAPRCDPKALTVVWHADPGCTGTLLAHVRRLSVQLHKLFLLVVVVLKFELRVPLEPRP